MNNLQKLFRKKNKLVIGLMSGTSADGIDAVALRVRGDGERTSFEQLAFSEIPYPKGFRKFLLHNSNASTANLADIARLNILLGELFADAAKRVARRAGTNLSNIDLIGSHGQTIAHYPEARPLFRKKVSSTLQIGDPSMIAKRTGVVTVGDFRVGDVAVGGSGAPLVPYVDYLLFRSKTKDRALVNIGGIANITVLPKNGTLDDVMAFDTGPGNMMIDALMMLFYKKEIDRNGEAARSGKILPGLLRFLMNHPYLKQRPPKSTGREMFGGTFSRTTVTRWKGHRPEDVIATVSAFTALAIFEAYLRFVRPRARLDELFVSGGGTHNQFILNLLKDLFEGVRVETVDAIGLNVDAKEAICFALLANEAIAGNPANVPGATGAKRKTVLGKICLP
jgi:anhydro-N-acetylmuramic acid kinase